MAITILTSDEDYRLQAGTLAQPTTGNTQMTWSGKKANNKALDSTLFSGTNTSIVNALNLLGGDSSKNNIATTKVADLLKDILGDLTDPTVDANYEKLKTLMGENTILNGLTSFYCEKIGIDREKFQGEYASGVSYVTGDLVSHEGRIYEVLTDFTASTWTTDVVHFSDARETEDDTNIIFGGEYQAGKAYSANMLILDSAYGIFYLVREDFTATDLVTDASKLSKFGSANSELTPATSTALGAVKIGQGLQVTQDGTVSVDKSALDLGLVFYDIDADTEI